jgi:hypothetical protein
VLAYAHIRALGDFGKSGSSFGMGPYFFQTSPKLLNRYSDLVGNSFFYHVQPIERRLSENHHSCLHCQRIHHHCHHCCQHLLLAADTAKDLLMSKTLNELIDRCRTLEDLANRALLALDEDDFPELRQDLRDALGIEDEEDDDDEPICSACNGSGEGMYDGSTCYKCRGYGHERTERSDEP